MSAPSEPALARFGRLLVRRRRIVVLTWVVVLVATAVLGPRIAGEWTVDYGTPGSESLAARTLLEAKFPDQSGDTMLVTWQAQKGAESKRATARIDRVLEELDAIPGIDVKPSDDAIVSPDGKTALLELPLSKRPANISIDDGPALMAIVDGASRASVKVRMGGIVIQEAQTEAVSSEAIGIAVALVILLLTFGTVVAAGLPIATALFGIGTGAAFVGAVAAFVETPAWAESVAAMIGIGVGIDYALLVLTRHRASLRAGASVEDSIAQALATAGHSVLVAGGTVVISLLGLFLMGLPYLYGVALAASASVLVVLVASLTLLPALLGFAGHGIDRLMVPGLRRKEPVAIWTPESGLPTPSDQSPGFARWTRIMQGQAWAATLLSLLLVAILTAPVAGVRLGFPGMGNDPEGTQTREAYDQMTRAFGPGVVGPISIVTPAGRDGDRKRLMRLRTKIGQDERVAAVGRPERSDDGSTLRMTVQSATEPESEESGALLGKLRDDLIPASGVPQALVGGYTAETRDQAYATETRLPLLFLGVGGLSAILLLVAFRSLVVPIKAALMNLFSIAAAYGVVALVAEGGIAGGLVGIDSNVPIPPFIPVLMFAVLFGLSMDYEVFLVGRIREYWAAHGDAERAVVEGVASTARVITAAAAIMIAVFGAFALSDTLILKLVGVGMAAAILIDATLIRLVLVPALMTLFGSRNWWLPGWLDRLVPQTSLEGTALAFEAEMPAAARAGAPVGAVPAARPPVDVVAAPAASPRVGTGAVPPPLLAERPDDWAEAPSAPLALRDDLAARQRIAEAEFDGDELLILDPGFGAEPAEDEDEAGVSR